MNKKIKLIMMLLISALLFLLTGCGNSSIAKDSAMVDDAINSSNISSAWSQYSVGGYDSAKKSFEEVLANTSPYDLNTVAKLNNGIGWCTVKIDGFADAKPYFEKAVAQCDDAKIGMAGCYLSAMNKTDFIKGIKYMESLNLNNANHQYEFEYDTGITNAQVHALLGVLYYLNGNTGSANSQFSVAGNIVDPDNDDISVKTINSILDALSN